MEHNNNRKWIFIGPMLLVAGIVFGAGGMTVAMQKDLVYTIEQSQQMQIQVENGRKEREDLKINQRIILQRLDYMQTSVDDIKKIVKAL